MVKDRNVHQPARLNEFARHFYIALGWRRVARWVIVCHDNCPRSLFHRMLENEVWLKRNLVTLAFCNLDRRGHHLVAGAKHYDKEPLLLVTVHIGQKQIISIFRCLDILRVAVFAFQQLDVGATATKLKRGNDPKRLRLSNAGYLLRTAPDNERLALPYAGPAHVLLSFQLAQHPQAL